MPRQTFGKLGVIQPAAGGRLGWVDEQLSAPDRQPQRMRLLSSDVAAVLFRLPPLAAIVGVTAWRSGASSALSRSGPTSR